MDLTATSSMPISTAGACENRSVYLKPICIILCPYTGMKVVVSLHENNPIAILTDRLIAFNYKHVGANSHYERGYCYCLNQINSFESY